ncbi:hypothetical protein WJX84_006176, partial [Apatococcus fuscideae]
MALFKITQGEFEGAEIRTTTQYPRRVAILDVIKAITGNVNPRTTWADLQHTYPHDVGENAGFSDSYKFPGRGYQVSPVTDARGLVTIMNLLQGERAARFRMKEADLLVRHLGGDLSLIQEIKDIRAQQEGLPADHPARIFGEDVEARASKRSLDDDLDIYNAKKQKLLAEIEAEKQRTLAAVKADVVEQLVDGSWILVRYVGSTMRERDSKVQEAWEPEWTDETFSQKRIKYSGAYR